MTYLKSDKSASCAHAESEIKSGPGFEMISLGFVNGPQLARPFIRHADNQRLAEIGKAFETTFFAFAFIVTANREIDYHRLASSCC